MKGFTLTILLALMLASAAGAEYVFDSDWSNFSYQVRVENGAYVWSLRNENYTQSLVNWTWAGGVVGQLPGSFPLESSLPLPPGIGARPWYQRGLYSNDPPVVVMATMIWADGLTIERPIYMPASAVPEPSGMLALGTALIGLAGMAWKRRSAKP